MFKQLYEEYYAPFCLYAQRYVHDRESCEDIVSEVFVNLWSHIDALEPDSNTTLAYIKVCVKNSCLNYLKHEAHKEAYAEFVQENSPECATDENVYTLRELYRMLHETLQKLPESHRQVFVKSFFEGKKQAEIAEELNISVKSVNRYKQKTYEFLKKELKDYFVLLLILTCG